MTEKRSETEKTIERIAVSLERSNFYDYVSFVSDEKRMLKRAFLSGLLRGLGMAVGFTVLGALAVYLLNLIAMSNIPYIAGFIKKIAEIVESNR